MTGQGLPASSQPDNDKDPNRNRYEYIAHQINREDGLINFRLTWTLQMNGFLFASLALVSKDIEEPIKDFFLFALPITGLLVSFAGVLGVIAAHRQLRYLTSMWAESKFENWPRPFGDSRAFSLGRLPNG